MNQITVFVVSLMLVMKVAEAQEPGQDSIRKYNLDEIIIQSPKYNRNVFEIPAAATMVPERLLEHNRVENLTDISPLIPNFFMPDYGSKLTSPVYIRGVGNRINTPSVGLYVDEIPYFEKAAFNFDFYDVERVEVLRGPQGTLYGRNAMGGLINILTTKPHSNRATEFSVDYGNYNQLRTTVSHNQPVGKSFAVQGSLNQRYNEGFYTNTFTHSDVDRLKSYSGRLKALYNPGNHLQVLGTVQYEDSRQSGYPYAVYNDDVMEAEPIGYDRESIYNRELLSAGLSIKYAAPQFNIRSASSLQTLNDFQDIDQDFTPASLVFVKQDQQMQMLAQEINIESARDGLYQWLFGVFGFQQLLDKAVTFAYGEDGLERYNMPYTDYTYVKTYDNSNKGVALFHQSTFTTGGLSVTAGIRADYEEASLDYVHDVTTNGNTNNADAVVSNLYFFEVLPKIAVKYSINPYLTPYATVSKGYNSGGFNATFEREEDRTFDPEHSWSYEAGLKAKWLQQRIYANLALFYIDWTSQQIYQAVPSGTGSMLTNAGKSVSKGVELELKALPVNRLETWITFGYNKAEFKEYVKDDANDFSGNYLPYVPLYTFNAGGNYEVNVKRGWLDRMFINISYNGIGKHYWHESNEAFQSFYGLLNSRISFEKNNIGVSVWGKNLLNTGYNSFYFQALGNSYAQIGKPATMGIKFKWNFN